MLPIATLLVNALLRDAADKWPNVYLRYAGKGTKKVSVACKIWVWQRWPDGGVVDLFQDVESIRDLALKRMEVKIQARAERALKEGEKSR